MGVRGLMSTTHDIV